MVKLLRRYVAATLLALAIPSGVLAASDPTPEQLSAEVSSLNWLHGPAEAKISDQAIVKIPKGIRYLDSTSTRRFLELNGNPAQDNSYTIAPEANTWFAILAFDRSGYVSDKESINPNSLFNALKSEEK